VPFVRQLADHRSPQTGRQGDAQGQPDRGRAQQFAEFARKEGRQLRRRADVFEVSAARFGHRRKQLLIEVIAEAERGGRHPPLAQIAGMLRKLARIDHPDIRLAIGEQDRPAHPPRLPRRLPGRDLLAPDQPALAEVG